MSAPSSGDHGRRTFIKTVVLSTGAIFLDWNVRADAAGTVPPKGVIATTGALDYKIAHEYLRDATKIVTPGKPKDVADIIVIGGGLSGLSAAWKIKQSGKRVVVLDNEPAIGGNVRDEAFGGTRTELGAVRFAQTGGAAGAMFADCGIAPIKIPGDGYFVDRSNTLHELYSEHTLRTSPVQVGTPIAFRNFRNGSLAIDPKPTFPLYAASKDLIDEYDRMEGTAVITAYPGVEIADWLDVFSMGMFGRTLDKTNAYSFYASYLPMFGEDFDSVWYSFAGGMSALPAAIAKKIGKENIRSRTLALRVENTPTGVLVTTLGPNGVETLRGRSVVVAVQKMIAGKLVVDLPGVQAYRMKNLTTVPSVTVELRCKEPLTKTRSFMVWFRDPTRRITRMYDATYLRDLAAGTLDRTTGEFIYTLPCIPGDTGVKSLESEEWLVSFAQLALDTLGQFLTKAYDVTTELRIFAWGHAIVSPMPGMITQLYPAMNEPFGGVYFGAADNDVCSTVDGAIANGIHAAELAMDHK